MEYKNRPQKKYQSTKIHLYFHFGTVALRNYMFWAGFLADKLWITI